MYCVNNQWITVPIDPKRYNRVYCREWQRPCWYNGRKPIVKKRKLKSLLKRQDNSFEIFLDDIFRSWEIDLICESCFFFPTIVSTRFSSSPFFRGFHLPTSDKIQEDFQTVASSLNKPGLCGVGVFLPHHTSARPQQIP